MTWAARYSRTEQPELTIWRDGEEYSRRSIGVSLDVWLKDDPYRCPRPDLCYMHNPDLRADIAARVPVRECIETDACRNHAVDGERCWDRGGSDQL